MSRSVDQIIREQLGSLLAEVAVLTAQKEALAEEIAGLKAKLGLKAKPAHDEEPTK